MGTTCLFWQNSTIDNLGNAHLEATAEGEADRPCFLYLSEPHHLSSEGRTTRSLLKLCRQPGCLEPTACCMRAHPPSRSHLYPPCQPSGLLAKPASLAQSARRRTRRGSQHGGGSCGAAPLRRAPVRLSSFSEFDRERQEAARPAGRRGGSPTVSTAFVIERASLEVSSGELSLHGGNLGTEFLSHALPVAACVYGGTLRRCKLSQSRLLLGTSSRLLVLSNWHREAPRRTRGRRTATAGRARESGPGRLRSRQCTSSDLQSYLA